MNTKETLKTEPQPKRLRSFVKPALIVVTFTVLLAYALFHFDQLRAIGGTLYDAVSPFITGMFIAYILNVFMNLFENVVFGKLTRGDSKFWASIKRPLCIILAFAVVILLILAVTLYIVPEIIQSLDLIIEAAKVNIPIYAKNITEWVNWVSRELNLDIVSEAATFLKEFDWTGLLTGATEFTSNFLNSILSATMSFASGLFTVILSIIFAVYFLGGKESLLLSMKRLAYSFLPKKAIATAADIAVTANQVFSSFVRGQLTECVIIGCLCFIGMSLIGFDYALLISCIIAMTALVPILGAYIGCVIGAFLLLLVNPMDSLIFVIFIVVLQQLEGNIIYPKVVGSTIGLPGVWVMAAVTICSNLFGIMGVLLGTPLAAVLYTILRRV
ncbi:MAG: AI-2E family transporter, partial [Clostridia bacterium]|nr:AI-2E family transporter [Clostridia bacterium]